MPKRNKNTRSAYLNVLKNPFTAPPCHVPDQVVTDAGIVTSRYIGTLPLTALGGTGTLHSGGMLFYPYPSYCSMVQIQENSVGTTSLQACNLASTALVSAGAVSNISGFGNNGRVRPIAMGVRVTYEGTELNRSGRIYAGLCPAGSPGFVLTGGINLIDPLSVICGGSPSRTTAELRQCMVQISSARVADGTFEAVWRPSVVPTYQTFNSANSGMITTGTPGVYATMANGLSSPDGGYGSQQNQNALVVWIENDTVTSAAVSGNTYALEVIWHWEVIPNIPQSVTYSLTPSLYNVTALQAALNTFKGTPMGHVFKETDISSGVGVVNITPSKRISATDFLSRLYASIPAEAKTAAKAAGAKAIKAAATAAARRYAGSGRRMIEL